MSTSRTNLKTSDLIALMYKVNLSERPQVRLKPATTDEKVVGVVSDDLQRLFWVWSDLKAAGRTREAELVNEFFWYLVRLEVLSEVNEINFVDLREGFKVITCYPAEVVLTGQAADNLNRKLLNAPRH